jgi:hypothetical protein
MGPVASSTKHSDPILCLRDSCMNPIQHHNPFRRGKYSTKTHIEIEQLHCTIYQFWRMKGNTTNSWAWSQATWKSCRLLWKFSKAASVWAVLLYNPSEPQSQKNEWSEKQRYISNCIYTKVKMADCVLKLWHEASPDGKGFPLLQQHQIPPYFQNSLYWRGLLWKDQSLIWVADSILFFKNWLQKGIYLS